LFLRLEHSDGGLLVRVSESDGIEALIEASEAKFSQLDSKLHSFDFSVLVRGHEHFELQSNHFSELVATWATEGDLDLVHVVTGDSVVVHLERNLHLERSLATNFEVNWHADHFDGKVLESVGSLLSKG